MKTFEELREGQCYIGVSNNSGVYKQLIRKEIVDMNGTQLYYCTWKNIDKKTNFATSYHTNAFVPNNNTLEDYTPPIVHTKYIAWIIYVNNLIPYLTSDYSSKEALENAYTSSLGYKILQIIPVSYTQK